jgi:hypothetical protein
MSYARARLWLGLSGMATIIGVALLALLLNLPALLPRQPASFGLELQSLLLVCLLWALVYLPFDLFGGYILPHEYNDNPPSSLDFAVAWGRGVAVQSGVYIVTTVCLMFVGRTLNFLPFVFTAGLLMVLLILMHKNMAHWVAGLPTAAPDLSPTAEQLDQWGVSLPDTIVVESKTRAFTGGIVGLPGSDEVIIPADWLSQLPTETTAYHIARRTEAIQAGGRRRGVWVAVVWNLIGLVLTSIVLAERIHLGSVSGVVTIGLGMTIWSWLGLVVLARPTRTAVHTLDRYLSVLGLDRSLVETTLAALEERQDGDAASANALLGLNYDIPTIHERLAALGESGFGTDRTAWHAGRFALYLSWAGLGFLGRALPAQLGRPELWTLPPVE